MTGFARVTENVIYRLKDDFEIVVLAHNGWGDPCEKQKDFKMYPSSNRFQTAPFGEQRIREIVEREQPDIVFTINDMWIINTQYQQIQDLHKQGKFKFVGYAPMDSYGWIGFERMRFGMLRDKKFAREREEFLEIVMILQRMVS